MNNLPTIETLVLNSSNGPHVMLTNANQFFIYNRISGAGHNVVFIRKGNYIGEQVSVVFRSDYVYYIPATGEEEEDVYNSFITLKIQDGAQFEARNLDDVPFTPPDGTLGGLRIRTQDVSQDIVIFLKWTGKNWLIEDYTHQGFYNVDTSFPFNEGTLPVMMTL